MAIVGARFVHFGFHWSGVPKVNELEPIFNLALDWARYAPNSWILWTNTDLETWLGRIKPLLGEGDHVFIGEMNLASTPANYTGWAENWLWDWIQKHR
jgi:hypothetical protein